jgi:DNA-3-methyladenine glycosylase II
MPLVSLNRRTLAAAAKELSDRDPHLRISFESFGTPPLWDRPQGFATLLQIILEQQVSLASAKACFDKLSKRVKAVTPESLLNCTDAELRADGFSRQKAGYARHLAESVIEKRIDLEAVAAMPDDAVKSELTKLKGVGDWTSDIYLLMALRRPDIMPKGDLALHIAWHKLSGEPRPTSDEFLQIAQRWRPYRSVAARLLWHYYLAERKNGQSVKTAK